MNKKQVFIGILLISLLGSLYNNFSDYGVKSYVKFRDNYENYEKITITSNDKTTDISDMKKEIFEDLGGMFYPSKMYRGTMKDEILVITFEDENGKSKIIKVLELDEEKFQPVNVEPSATDNSITNMSGAFYFDGKLCVAKFYNGYFELDDDLIKLIENIE